MKMFIKRIYAGLIDITFVGAIIYLLYTLYFYNGIKLGDFTVDSEWFVAEYKLVFNGAVFVYFIICEMFDFSVGKKFFKLKINYGKRIKTARFLRPLFKILLFIVYPLAILSLFLKDNLLFYDYILGTTIEDAKYERRDLRWLIQR